MSILDNHGEIPAGLHEITNTTGRPERIYTQQAWGDFKKSVAHIVKSITKAWDELRKQGPFLNLIAQQHAISNGDRYWYDHQGQPHRNPTMQPLLHNGKAPR